MTGVCGPRNDGWVTKAYYAARAVFNDPEPILDPKQIKKEMTDDVHGNAKIKMARDGKINFTYNSTNDTVAMKIIQRAFISLGVMKVDTCEPLWWSGAVDGAYGPQTLRAVDEFQRIAGIPQENGSPIGPQTIMKLEVALQAKAQGRDWRAAVANK